jgi:tetratricopeptide (TPR) repeat protein
MIRWIVFLIIFGVCSIVVVQTQDPILSSSLKEEKDTVSNDILEAFEKGEVLSKEQYRSLGRYFLVHRNATKSLEALSKVEDPNLYDYERKIRANILLEEPEKALSLYKECLTLLNKGRWSVRNLESFHHVIGAAFLASMYYSEAIVPLTEAEKIQSSPDLLYNLGTAYAHHYLLQKALGLENQTLAELAVRYLTSALRSDQPFAEPALALGNFYYKNNQLRLAQEYFEKAAYLHPFHWRSKNEELK